MDGALAAASPRTLEGTLMMDAHSGVPLPPKGESPTNRADRIRLTEVRKSRSTEAKPNAMIGESPESRSDRIRETGVRGLTLKHYIERKTDRY
jgi:hypothetical protein